MTTEGNGDKDVRSAFPVPAAIGSKNATERPIRRSLTDRLLEARQKAVEQDMEAEMVRDVFARSRGPVQEVKAEPAVKLGGIDVGQMIGLAFTSLSEVHKQSVDMLRTASDQKEAGIASGLNSKIEALAEQLDQARSGNSMSELISTIQAIDELKARWQGPAQAPGHIDSQVHLQIETMKMTSQERVAQWETEREERKRQWEEECRERDRKWQWEMKKFELERDERKEDKLEERKTRQYEAAAAAEKSKANHEMFSTVLGAVAASVDSDMAGGAAPANLKPDLGPAPKQTMIPFECQECHTKTEIPDDQAEYTCKSCGVHYTDQPETASK